MSDVKWLKFQCQNCGSRLLPQNGNDDTYVCEGCGKVFTRKAAEDADVKLRSVLNEQKQEQVANLRRRLYKEVNEKYVSNRNVEQLCRQILDYLPEDVYANFYLYTCNGRSFADFFAVTDVSLLDDGDRETMVTYLTTALKKEWFLATDSILDGIKEKELRASLRDNLERKKKLVDNCVFEPRHHRQIFVCYASEDLPIVNRVVAAIEKESQKLECFVAARNLQHGSGAKDRYKDEIHAAIDNCDMMLFFSSAYSRDLYRDTYKLEINYVKEHDPSKPRLEYIITTYEKTHRVSDEDFKEFFDGCERCITNDDAEVVRRVLSVLNQANDGNKQIDKPTEAPPVKTSGLQTKLRKLSILISAGKFDGVADSLKRLEVECESSENSALLAEIYYNKLLVDFKARGDNELVAYHIKSGQDIADNTNYCLAEGFAESGSALASRLNSIKIRVEEGIAKIKEEERKAKEEADRKAKEEAARKAKEEAARKAKEEAERKAKEEERQRKILEEERKRKEAEIAQDFEIKDGVLVKYKGEGGDVIIPDGVTAIGRKAFYLRYSLTSVIIPNGVTSIGDEAFNCCDLTSITIPNGVTHIGNCVFFGCSLLTSINVSPDNKNYKSIDGNLYSNNGKTLLQYAIRKTAKSFIIPNSVTSIDNYAFFGCKSLTSITIPDGVTSIGKGAFLDCKSLTNINVSSDNRKYKSIDGNLYSYDCKTLLQYAIGKTANSFTIPNSVTSIGESAFAWCDSLRSITIPNSVTSIGVEVFRGCSSLSNITIPSSVTSIGGYAFVGCKSLKTIYCEAKSMADGWSARWLSDCKAEVVWGYTSTQSQKVANSQSISPFAQTNVNDFEIKDGVLVKYKGKGGDVIIPDGVTAIDGSAFWKCTLLTSVTIPNSVTSIGHGAFWGCTSLTSITIPNSVISIGNSAFVGCNSLTSITIPQSVTSIGDSAFEFCSSLTSITIPNSVTHIDDSAFRDCKSLKSIAIPNSVTSIGDYAFWDCTSLTKITIPNSVTSIGGHVFANCTSLTSITIPNSVTSIGAYAFANCTSLTSVTIPNSVTSIGYSAFYNCTSLKSIAIPNSVTSIGYSAFSDCTSLKSITIPQSVTSIGYNVFHGCDSLKTIYCRSKKPLFGLPAVWDKEWLGNCNAKVIWNYKG